MPDVDARLGAILLGWLCLIVAGCGSEPEPKTVEPEAQADEKSWLEEEDAFTYTRGTSIFRPTETEAQAIKQTIRDFLRARSVDELERVILDPERMLPKVEAYYQSHPFVSGGVHVDPQFRNAGKYIVTELTFDRGRPPRLLAIKKTDSGYKVNWEIFVQPIPENPERSLP